MEERVVPIIIRELCTECGACVEVCPHGALRLADGAAELDLSMDCEFCGNCEAVCPTEAIRRPFVVVFEQPAA